MTDDKTLIQYVYKLLDKADNDEDDIMLYAIMERLLKLVEE